MPPNTETTANDAKLALTRQRILAEAVTFADENDLDSLTMRKLAERLGAGTMSLYNHVANKDDMIEGMVDVISAEIEHPSGDDWRKAMQDSAVSAHQVLLAHRWAAGEWTSRKPGPARVRYMESILRVLTEAGLGASLVYHGYHAITMHIVGFTIQELGFLTGPNDMDLSDIGEETIGDLGVAGLPHLAEHLRAHLSADDHGDEFRFVLDLLLDGLERSSNHDR